MDTDAPLRPIEIAALNERRMVIGVRRVAPESEPWNGNALMCFGEPGSWINHAMGLEPGADVPDDAIQTLEDWYRQRRVEPALECTHFLAKDTLRRLADRGFTLRGFETILARAIGPEDRAIEPAAHLDAELRLRPVDPDRDADVDAFADCCVTGFGPLDPPDDSLPASFRAVARAPGVRSFLAEAHDGGAWKPIAGGAIEVASPVAPDDDAVPDRARGVTIGALITAATLEPYRRRGVQRALLLARLRTAADLGASVAVIGGEPGAGTDRNAARLGFSQCFSRVKLAKAGPQLAQSAW